MKSGGGVTNISELHQEAGLEFIPDLIARKFEAKVALPHLNWNYHRGLLLILPEKMDLAFEASPLPEYRDEDSVDQFSVDFRMRNR